MLRNPALCSTVTSVWYQAVHMQSRAVGVTQAFLILEPYLLYPTLPYPTLNYPTIPYPELPYHTLPQATSCACAARSWWRARRRRRWRPRARRCCACTSTARTGASREPVRYSCEVIVLHVRCSRKRSPCHARSCELWRAQLFPDCWSCSWRCCVCTSTTRTLLFV